jgi:uncharacterized membrane protein
MNAQPKGVLRVFRNFIVRGIVFALPIAVTIFVVNFALTMVDSWMGGPTAAIIRWVVPAKWLTGAFADGHIPGMSMILLLLILAILGAIASWKVGSQGLRLLDVIMLRIPGVGGIYASTRKIVDSFGASNRFQRVVFVKFMGETTEALGFVTDEHVEDGGRNRLTVFVPHIPNPTSGVLLRVWDDETTPSDMTPQEGFKWVMSFGTLHEGD